MNGLDGHPGAVSRPSCLALRDAPQVHVGALDLRRALGRPVAHAESVRHDAGAGKTTFVRGAARSLGIQTPITSPTFTIGQRYRGRVPVSHLDLFRIAAMSDEDPDLLADYLGPDTIAFVEWPEVGEDALAGLGRVAVRVVIEHAGGDRRSVRIEAGDEVRST